MSLFDAIMLGSIQGITEFLPISSSGHLVIAQSLLGIELPGNIIEVVTHLGTLLSVIIIYREEIIKILLGFKEPLTKKYIIFLVIGTIPAAVIGVGAKTFITEFFESIKLVSVSLIFTGLILFLSNMIKTKKSSISINKSLLIGLSQALAIIPGISRSGMTITIGTLLGLNPKDAAKFSFLLAIPIISGAGLITAIDLVDQPTQISYNILFAALVSSFIVGYISLKWLLGILESGKLHFFGYYCTSLGIITLMIS